MQTQLIVQNLKCGGCASTISKHLAAMNDLSEVKIDAETSSVAFSYSEENSLYKVMETLNQLGYPVEGEANTYLNKAKSFISCATGKMNH